MNYILLYIEEFINLSNEMSPYLLLGFIVAGILHVVISKDKIAKYLGKNNLKSLLYAALLGIPIPLCSCGVIPTAIAFRKEGASEGATISFLIATPQTGVDSIMVTYSMLGLPFAIIRPIIALISGVIGGAYSVFFTKPKEIAKPKPQFTLNIDSCKGDDNCECGDWKKEKKHSLVEILKYGFLDLMEDIAKWLLIGLAIAALISVAIPDNFFVEYISNPFLNIFIVLAISVPLYICATGSVPLAAVLIMKGISPGAALVFLMAGPATNIATITVLTKSLGKKTTIIYVTSIIITAIVFALIIDYLLPSSWFELINHNHNHEHNSFGWFQISSTIALFILVINALLKKNKMLWYAIKKTKEVNLKISVHGMTCNHCKANVEKHVSQLQGVTSVIATPSKNEVVIIGKNFSLEKIKNTISGLGYSVKD